jgi:hypothetical protein
MRWSAVALGAMAFVVAITTGWRDAAERRALSAEAIRLGVGDAATLQRIRFMPDLDLARLATTRAALDRDLQAVRSARPVSLERLRWAEATAALVRDHRPRFFEAASTLALARLLVLQQTRDPRLYTERALWEEPLRDALRLAPHELEPRTILLRARLALWFSLSSAERDETRELAKSTFDDPFAFDSLIPAWYAANDPWTKSADDVVPDSARALRAVSYTLAGRGEFEAVARLRRRAAARFALTLDSKDDSDGEARDLDRLAGAPPSREFAGAASALIERIAPATLQGLPKGDLVAWWAWAVDEASAGREGLSRTAAERLALAVGAFDCERALVELASPSTPIADAQRLEPAAAAGGLDPCWQEYLLAKARRLEEQGQVPTAQAARELANQVGGAANRPFRLRSDRVLIATRAPANAEVRLVVATGRQGDARTIDLSWDGWWQTSLAVPPNGVVIARLAIRGGDVDPATRARTLVVTGVVGGRPEPLAVSFSPSGRELPAASR